MPAAEGAPADLVNMNICIILRKAKDKSWLNESWAIRPAGPLQHSALQTGLQTAEKLREPPNYNGKLMSGRKIVGSAAEGLISILYCESQWAVSWSPPTQKWRMAVQEGKGQRWKRGCSRPDGGIGKVKEDSFTKTDMVLRVREERTGEVLEGLWLPPWNQAVWGNWVQVQWQTFVCMMRWWRLELRLSWLTPNLLLPVTAGEHRRRTKKK